MSLKRGRVVRAEHARGATPILKAGPSDAQRVRMASEEAQAHVNAERVIHMAIARSEAVLAGVRADSERHAREAGRAAAEEEQAKLAATWLALRDTDEKRAERDLDRAVALARVIAERLVGRALELDPRVVAGIAREAMAETRGARSVRIEAHPLDAEALRAELVSAGLGAPSGASIDIVSSDALARGSLTVHTELGTADARLHPRLERLAAALRDALRST